MLHHPAPGVINNSEVLQGSRIAMDSKSSVIVDKVRLLGTDSYS